ncbi:MULTISPECIES: hypothetical protein [Calothrix]|uniref:Uncharacterized protein n=2 Tax=Calothrix TaxID=1186 RepID=A0ABR8ANZ8_9CYAN|nr:MULTISPECIES: hypothetical protein [Calothrix]MBD2200411.1 hypothetical protein [Calothrix parietina FACHB-288]MBD2229392.1 hypothetical protein [Calothrix anomala FACHB-343]
MPNPKGTPENLEPGTRKGQEPFTDQLSFRVTRDMKEAVKAQDDPAQFCRDAIQEKLDRNKPSEG